MTDQEWNDAAMFGEFKKPLGGEETLSFRRIDLAAYLAADRKETLDIMNEMQLDYFESSQRKRGHIKVLLGLLKDADNVLSTITDDEGFCTEELNRLRGSIEDALAWGEL